MQLLEQHIEALIFTAESSVAADDIISCLNTLVMEQRLAIGLYFSLSFLVLSYGLV